MEDELFICECGSVEHQFVVSSDTDHEWDEIYISVRLNHWGNFFQRAVRAVKYLFKGCEAGYGEVILDEAKTQELIRVLKAYKFSKKG